MTDMSLRGKPEQVRFWAKVDKTETCWLWTPPTSSHGYGGFYVDDGRTVRAHRYSYQLLVGPIPAGLVLDHLCRVTRCVNPDHLEPVTVAENNRRRLASVMIQTGQCGRGHGMTPENTYLRRDGTRVCKTCRRRTQRDFLARRRERRELSIA